MHDIGRKLIMGGSSAGGQSSAAASAIVTTATSTALNGSAAVETTTSSSTPVSSISNGNYNHHSHAVSSASSVSSSSNSGDSFVVENLEDKNRGEKYMNNNNNNCVVKQRLIGSSGREQQVILCTSNKSDRPLSNVERIVAGPVTMNSGGCPPDRPVVPKVTGGVVVNNNNRIVSAGGKLAPGQVVTTTFASSSSSAASSTSSRSSSLSTSPMPMLIREEEDEEVVVEREVRKVEPLKINLHREPIRTVIKLGGGGGQSPVKSISSIANSSMTGNNSMVVVSSTNEFNSAEEVNAIGGDMDGGIPKLHIRMNHEASHQEHSTPTQPPIGIPKLTIRNAGTGAAAVANCTASSSTGNLIVTAVENTVPKLTIKMDHHNSPHVQTPLPRLTIKTNSLGNRAVDVLLSPSAGGLGQSSDHLTPEKPTLTVPKLTIKVPNETAVISSAPTTTTGALEGPAGSILGERLLLSPSSRAGGGVVVVGSSSSIINSNSGDGSIPKLTLKNLGRPAATVVVPSTGHHHHHQHHHHHHHSPAMEESPSFQIMNPPPVTNHENPPPTGTVPKLKVKVARIKDIHEENIISDEVVDEHEDEDMDNSVEEEQKRVPRIRKLTIKAVMNHPKTSYGTNQQAQQHQANDMNRTRDDNTPPAQETVTKLVIKPIPKPESTPGDSYCRPETGATQSSSIQLPAGNHHVHHHHRHNMGPDGDRLLQPQPLEISTGLAATASHLSPGGGPQSPRIILKIHKNQNSIVSNTEVVDGAEDNLLKRHLQQEFVNSTSKRVKPDEKTIKVIDLDSEVEEVIEEPRRGQKNGRLEEVGHGREALDCDKGEVTGIRSTKEESGSSSSSSSSYDNSEETMTTTTESRANKLIVPVVGLDESKDDDDFGSEAAMDSDPLVIQPTMQTPPVKRGRGRPRKTPIVPREGLSAQEGEAKKPRGRKKVIAEDTPVPTIDPAKNSRIPEDDNVLQSPVLNSSTKKPRGGGRGGGRTPGVGRGGGARRGRGAAASATRKPFNKERYFKQKTFEESIISSYFEEDTRMSADTTPSTPKIPMAGSTSQLDPQDSISQSSHLSSTSVTMDSTQTSSTPARKKLKMEVVGAIEGKTEFTVDMLAEYDWPPGVGCCPNKNRDTYMIQEQIAEYLGVKSFKRKYPDLDRRTVEMEERNYLIERGLVTEKMCDLGVTAVYAVDVLDIMYQDFHEKYEKYKQYHREKVVSLRQKLHKSELGIGAREKAMRSVSKWNANLNKERKEERRIHMDLQNYTIQVPEVKRKNMTFAVQKPPLYPLAVVVGQFSEYYKTYSPAELGCFPINTVISDPEDLMKRVLEEKMAKVEDAEATSQAPEVAVDSSSDSSSSNDDDESNDSADEEGSVDDSSSSESECDVNDDDLCCVCAQTQFTSQNNVPEIFVKCAICMKMAHPSCIEMSTEMAKRAFQYMWQCVDCKRCQGCQKSEDVEKMLYCQQCDRAYHIYCVKSLQSFPKGPWHCDICSICHQCGCRNPDGTNNSVSPKQQLLLSPSSQRPNAEWMHELVVNPATGLKEHCGMLCVRCAPGRSRNGPSTSSSS